VKEWRFTGFYGQLNRQRREETWHLLWFLHSTSTLPWLCAGDFNEVLTEEEHFGRRERGEWTMMGFREAVDYCGFFYLGFCGLPYTWDNKQKGDRNVKVRLDRGLANDKFLGCFPFTEVTHIQTSESDHCALMIEIANQVQTDQRRNCRMFRYENMWTRDPSYNDLIKRAGGVVQKV
jgi:endonuclease/exonuclease/phosphatase family metal-dependent hydrolase